MKVVWDVLVRAFTWVISPRKPKTHSAPSRWRLEPRPDGWLAVHGFGDDIIKGDVIVLPGGMRYLVEAIAFYDRPPDDFEALVSVVPETVPPPILETTDAENPGSLGVGPALGLWQRFGNRANERQREVHPRREHL